MREQLENRRETLRITTLAACAVVLSCNNITAVRIAPIPVEMMHLVSSLEGTAMTAAGAPPSIGVETNAAVAISRVSSALAARKAELQRRREVEEARKQRELKSIEEATRKLKVERLSCACKEMHRRRQAEERLQWKQQQSEQAQRLRFTLPSMHQRCRAMTQEDGNSYHRSTTENAQHAANPSHPRCVDSGRGLHSGGRKDPFDQQRQPTGRAVGQQPQTNRGLPSVAAAKITRIARPAGDSTTLAAMGSHGGKATLQEGEVRAVQQQQQQQLLLHQEPMSHRRRRRESGETEILHSSDGETSSGSKSDLALRREAKEEGSSSSSGSSSSGRSSRRQSTLQKTLWELEGPSPASRPISCCSSSSSSSGFTSSIAFPSVSWLYINDESGNLLELQPLPTSPSRSGRDERTEEKKKVLTTSL